MATKIFQIVSEFSSACQNIARMATKFPPKFFKIFKRLPKCYQNGKKIVFKLFQNSQALAKMLPEWQQKLFFQIFSEFLSACQNVSCTTGLEMLRCISMHKVVQYHWSETFVLH